MSLQKHDTYDLKTWKPYAANVLARFTPGNSMALILLFLCSERRAPLVAWPVQALFLSSALEALPSQVSPFQAFWLSGNYVCWFTSAIVMGALVLPLFYNLRPQQKPTHIMVVLAAVISLRALVEYGYGLLPIIQTDANVVVRLLEIIAGALTAQLATAVPPSLLQWQGWGWVFDGVICITLLLNKCVVMQGWLMGIPSEVQTLPLWTTHCMLVLMPIVIFSAFAAAQNGLPSSGLLGRCLAYKPLSSMAKYSFGAYIYQVLAARVMAILLSRFHSDHDDASGCIRTLMEWAPIGLSLLFAFVSEHFLEKHIRSMVQKRIRGETA